MLGNSQETSLNNNNFWWKIKKFLWFLLNFDESALSSPDEQLHPLHSWKMGITSQHRSPQINSSNVSKVANVSKVIFFDEKSCFSWIFMIFHEISGSGLSAGIISRSPRIPTKSSLDLQINLSRRVFGAYRAAGCLEMSVTCLKHVCAPQNGARTPLSPGTRPWTVFFP